MTDSTRRQIGAATLIWMLSAMASRVAGLFREMVIARSAGATGQTDVYFAAFTIPEYINYLLAGGALSITFIPIFTALMVRADEEEGWKVFSTVMTLFGSVLVTLLVLGWVFAEPLTALTGRGFSPEKQELLVRYTRILIPAQFFFFTGGLFGAVQMARGRHLNYAMAGLIYNFGIIVGGLLLGPRMGMEGFCWGALAGAFLGHGVLQPLGARKVGMRFRPRFALRHPSVRQYVLLTLPFMIGQSILLTDDWLVRYFGSFLSDASISWLNYAKRLALVIPAVLGQAAAAAAFPALSRQAEEGRFREMAATLGEGLSRALLPAIACAVLLGVLSREATFLAFGSGRFTPSAILATAMGLAILVAGVPGWVAQSILARGFFALRDMWTPTMLGTAVTLLAIPTYGVMARAMEARGGGYLGLAIVSALSITLYSVTLYFVLLRKIRAKAPDAPPLIRPATAMKGAAVAFLVWAAAMLARNGAAEAWPDLSLADCTARALVTILAAGVTFLFAARRMGLIADPVSLLRTFRRRPPGGRDT